MKRLINETFTAVPDASASTVPFKIGIDFVFSSAIDPEGMKTEEKDGRFFARMRFLHGGVPAMNDYRKFRMTPEDLAATVLNTKKLMESTPVPNLFEHGWACDGSAGGKFVDAYAQDGDFWMTAELDAETFEAAVKPGLKWHGRSLGFAGWIDEEEFIRPTMAREGSWTNFPAMAGLGGVEPMSAFVARFTRSRSSVFVPDTLVSPTGAPISASEITNTSPSASTKETEMKLSAEAIRRLGLAENASEADIEKAIANLSAKPEPPAAPALGASPQPNTPAPAVTLSAEQFQALLATARPAPAIAAPAPAPAPAPQALTQEQQADALLAQVETRYEQKQALKAKSERVEKLLLRTERQGKVKAEGDLDLEQTRQKFRDRIAADPDFFEQNVLPNLAIVSPVSDNPMISDITEGGPLSVVDFVADFESKEQVHGGNAKGKPNALLSALLRYSAKVGIKPSEAHAAFRKNPRLAARFAEDLKKPFEVLDPENVRSMRVAGELYETQKNAGVVRFTQVDPGLAEFIAGRYRDGKVPESLVPAEIQQSVMHRAGMRADHQFLALGNFRPGTQEVAPFILGVIEAPFIGNEILTEIVGGVGRRVSWAEIVTGRFDVSKRKKMGYLDQADRGSFGFTWHDEELDLYADETQVDRTSYRDGAALPVSVQAMALDETTSKSRRKREYAQASFLRNTASYAAGYTTDVSGAGSFEDGSSDWLQTLIDGAMKMLATDGWPDLSWWGKTPLIAAQKHPKTLAAVTVATGSAPNGIVKPETVSAILGIPIITTTARASVTPGAAPTQIWGGDVGLVLTMPGEVATRRFAMTLVSRGYPRVRTYAEENDGVDGSDVLNVADGYDLVPISNTAGYLVQNAGRTL